MMCSTEFDKTKRHHIFVYEVYEDGTLSGRRLFASVGVYDGSSPGLGVPDGIKVDTKGRVYIGTPDGVQGKILYYICSFKSKIWKRVGNRDHLRHTGLIRSQNPPQMDTYILSGTWLACSYEQTSTWRVFWWDWTLCSKHRHHCRFNRGNGWEGSMSRSFQGDIFNLTSYCFCISTLILKLGMIVFVIHKC